MAISADRSRNFPIPRGKVRHGFTLGRGKTVEVTRLELALYVFLLLLLLLLLWSARREHASHVKVPQVRDFERELPSIANLTGSPIIPGNRVQVLENGDPFFSALFADIASARESIHIETYVWWQGDVCVRLAKALSDKARQGVEVRLQVDAVGSKKGDENLFEEIKAAGGKVEKFHPFRLVDLGLLNNRTHRKLAIIDGRVAYVFGHGIAKEWTGHAQDEKHWRDTGVRLEGPVVNAIQGVFAENWMDQSSEVISGTKYFPALPPAGHVRAHVTASSPQGGVSRLELLFKLAIATAQKELLIQNPYFIPDAEVVGLLDGAVKRGVAVRVMVPGAVTDSSIVRHAGHYHYEELLRDGVKICEYQPTLNHEKVMIVDGVWAHVGSTNFDDRSLDINDEASVGLIDPGVAGQLRASFYRDARQCKPVELRVWSQRSWWHRLEDNVSYAMNAQL
jgi:cardiolipin synthase